MKRYEDAATKAALGGKLHPGGRALTEKALALAAFPAAARILDIGAGDGATVALLRESYGYEAVGVEPSPLLRARAGELHPGLELIAAVGERLPFDDGVFDGVLAECVLSLVADAKAVVAEMRRVLKPGGVAVIADLYSRAGSVTGCQGQMLRNRQELEALLAPFRLLHFSDQSGVLAALAAEMVWNGIPPAAFLGGKNAKRWDEKCEKGGGKAGYCLIAAEKEEKR